MHSIKKFKVGMQIKALKNRGNWNRGEVFTIAVVDNSPSQRGLGITTDTPRSNFHDLGGVVEDGRGYWLSPESVIAEFTLISNAARIEKEVLFKKRSLKGKKGRIIDRSENEVMLELEDNIGAGNGDGAGKAGHCVVVPMDSIEIVT